MNSGSGVPQDNTESSPVVFWILLSSDYPLITNSTSNIRKSSSMAGDTMLRGLYTLFAPCQRDKPVISWSRWTAGISAICSVGDKLNGLQDCDGLGRADMLGRGTANGLMRVYETPPVGRSMHAHPDSLRCSYARVIPLFPDGDHSERRYVAGDRAHRWLYGI